MTSTKPATTMVSAGSDASRHMASAVRCHMSTANVSIPGAEGGVRGGGGNFGVVQTQH
jgi:hypothetical protein